MNRQRRFRIGKYGYAGIGFAVLLAVGLTSWMSLVSSASPIATFEEQPTDLVIHEWGTFLGMSGSDGTALDGMYHEEHALPSFVHARSRDQLRLPAVFLKGETPVIYFYTQKPQSVRLGVGFPKGVWTQWYPQALRVEPSLVQQAQAPDRIRDGRICWAVDLIPASVAEARRQSRSGDIPALPPTNADALWHFARDVDAAYVQCVNNAHEPPAAEYERFLFYRGLGEARLPLRLDASSGGTLTLDSDPTIGDGVRHVFVLRVEKGRAAYRYLPIVRSGQTVANVIPSPDETKPLKVFTKTIAADLASRLEASGLYAKEARAMVNTWTTSYFQTDGIRVLFVLPQRWTDSFIPMSVTPRPKQVVRVMVGRLELLSREREQLAEAAIKSLASADATRRSEAYSFLAEQGRYVEPMIRRVFRTTHDDKVQRLCLRLLKTEFVTDLRAAVHNAADGKRLTIDPLLLRAHLARLLREIGLEQEARAEGVAILGELEGTDSATRANNALPPQRKEARAAALEATGIDRAAAAVYADCVGQFVSTMQGDFNPETVSWCRDWWVGRGYGKSVVRSGEAEQVALQLQLRLAGTEFSPLAGDVRRCRLLLAYLYEARGAQEMADRIWSSLSPAAPAGTISANGPGVADRTVAR
jgi:hypothetical protein